jgi:hypothetical protein
MKGKQKQYVLKNIKPKAAKVPKSQEQIKLERIHKLLDLSVLQALNDKSIERDYGWGHQPLLLYTPEALTEYATAIYQCLQPLGAIYTTLDDYISQWLDPEKALRDWLAEYEGNIITTLTEIASDPVQPDDRMIEDGGLYTQISAFLSGDRDYFQDLASYLFCVQSPLRIHAQTTADQRVLDLLAMVDAMRDKCNNQLIRFVGKESDGTRIKLGAGLRRCRRFVIERLNYLRLDPTKLALLEAHKEDIPADVWATISDALAHKALSNKVKDLFNNTAKAISKSLEQTHKNTDIKQTIQDDIASKVADNERFICDVINRLETDYAQIVPTTAIHCVGKVVDSDIDDIMALIAVVQQARETGKDITSLQAKSRKSEEWYCNFDNIRQPLMACLQVVLNQISPGVLLAPDTVSHGAVQGMLAYAAEYVRQKRSGYIDYTEAAQELHRYLKHYTQAFFYLPPLPDIQPVGEERLLEAIAETVRQAKNADLSFNLTRPIQAKIDTLRPTVAFTEYAEAVLSETDIQFLVPVQDRTISQLLVLFAGKGTTPYMLGGDLIARTAEGAYLKILPEIKEDGYANYKFTGCNRKALSWLIDKYCDLLSQIPAYNNLIGYRKDAGEQYFGIEPVYDYYAEDTDDDIDDGEDYALKVINYMLKARMQSNYNLLSVKSLSERLALQKRLYTEDCELLDYLQFTVNRVYGALNFSYKSPKARYFDPPYYITGHNLSMWVSDPIEYTAKITNGGGKWTIDHKQQGFEYRSDNHPGNLHIVPQGYNSGRTSRSIGVTYNGTPYVSLSAYCTATDAGNDCVFFCDTWYSS